MTTGSINLVILGSGTSSSIPSIPCLTDPAKKCKVCLSSMTPAGTKNLRRNTSCLIQYNHPDGRVRNIMIDCGKTYLEGARELFPKHNVQRVDALVLTHGHADAFFGLDDLRSWCLIDKNNPYSIPVYLDTTTMDVLASTFPYMVDSSKATGGGDIPSFNYTIIDHNKDFEVEGLKFTPLPVEHGRYFSKNEPFWSLGFRFGDVSWISDCNSIPDTTTAKVAGSKILFVDGLREEPHPSHFSVKEAIEYGSSLTPKPEKVFIVGFCHRVDHYEQEEKMQGLDQKDEPQFRVAYDGMVLEAL
ncbi:hypothetical protein BGZ73_001691 [Actinomortierella ambigua]|nr:hypothetical protein BGZ73_001691 [Actinomortierella ambigua]